MRDTRDEVITFLASVAIFILIILAIGYGAIKLSEATCNAKMVDMGFNHRWALMQGYQIEVEKDKWIPLDSYYFKQE